MMPHPTTTATSSQSQRRRSVQKFSFLWVLTALLVTTGISQLVTDFYLLKSSHGTSADDDAPGNIRNDDDFQRSSGNDKIRNPRRRAQKEKLKIQQQQNDLPHQQQQQQQQQQQRVNSNNAGISINDTSSEQQRQQQLLKRNPTTTDAIVYLAQFGQHSSYGAQYDAQTHHILTGVDKLHKSLTHLYDNYVTQFPNVDIIIFYDYQNTPSLEVQHFLSQNRPQIQFHQLNQEYWSLPSDININRVKRPKFSMGYRHMMQWFAVLLWPYLAGVGYTHVMRMDDDSYIYTKIQYDLFQFMRTQGKRYGFRQPIVDPVHGKGYDDLISKFLTDNPNTTTPTQISNYNTNPNIGFYNNWFIADISFFLTPPASLLLKEIDMSRIMYVERTGDLVVHSTLVRLFLQPDEIQWFRDFTYEHMTLCGLDSCRGCPQTGGVSRGRKKKKRNNASDNNNNSSSDKTMDGGNNMDDHNDDQDVMSDEEWNELAHSVKARFNDKVCKRNKFSLTNVFVGAGGVGYCEKLNSECGYYLKLLLDDDELEKEEEETGEISQTNDGEELEIMAS